jgi:hypothetical protein
MVNANGMGLSPLLVHETLRRSFGDVPATARAHSGQIESCLLQALRVRSVYSTTVVAKDFPSLRGAALTLAGIPLVQDDTMPTTRVEFCDANGALIAAIENLAVPVEPEFTELISKLTSNV